jgi:hypothetical protein
MAINKITPRALDKSTDYKLVPSTAFIDAVNVVFSEDESSGSGDETLYLAKTSLAAQVMTEVITV